VEKSSVLRLRVLFTLYKTLRQGEFALAVSISSNGVSFMTAEMGSGMGTDRLLKDFQAVVRDAEALLKATTGVAGEKVQEVRSRAEETVKQAQASIEAIQDEAIQRAKEVAGAADSYVRENPWQAIGVAAGVGLVLGFLLSRRS
jgi:ElaB/YqjD/DUF883 family membrane-anchored ribosome-binding protein